jgi:hypothetical protein
MLSEGECMKWQSGVTGQLDRKNPSHFYLAASIPKCYPENSYESRLLASPLFSEVSNL